MFLGSSGSEPRVRGILMSRVQISFRISGLFPWLAGPGDMPLRTAPPVGLVIIKTSCLFPVGANWGEIPILRWLSISYDISVHAAILLPPHPTIYHLIVCSKFVIISFSLNKLKDAQEVK